MLHHPRLSLSGVALITALGGAFPAFAEVPIEPASPTRADASQDAAAVAPLDVTAPVPEMFGAVAVDVQALDTSRGGAETVVILDDIKASGTVHDNEAHNLTTGNNYIDGSFAGANGYSTVLQNSGNNVLIQNSTIVNVQVQ